ncbi:hypothetical protein CMI47_09520 [Candidatus Pacearchaeota archaeon]|nr:hypothetical protein [Candidatus Pacearchaeota archaeon]|tara:strand:+ start:20371 stop:20676 length:306 start_codon:yes stop_codon:yes gene_type:complete
MADDLEINAKAIEEWALESPNLQRATELGKRLISVSAPSDLDGLDSLGEFEDSATDWALENKFKARLLILKLLPTLKKRLEEAETESGSNDAPEEGEGEEE